MPVSPRNNLPNRPSSVSDFKKKPEAVKLPSGLSMVLKHTSMTGFIQGGNIPNALLKVVQGAIADQKGEDLSEDSVDVSELLADPSKLKDVFGAVDAFVISVAIEPQVHPTPDDEADRQDDLLYVDEIELEDKMFIFGRAMGSTDSIAPFPSKPTKRVGSIQPRKTVGSPTKRAPRS